jgi:methionyl aminopeptidase
MSITKESELNGMQQVSEAVAVTLRQMRDFAKPGMSTKTLDEFGGKLLSKFGARPAPKLSYNFPGNTCISVNHEIAHGIPSQQKILQEGDLINIDVSAEFNGYWSDNGCSFVIGNDVHDHQCLVDASKTILYRAIANIRDGVRIADIGGLIETHAREYGYVVIRNLTGHGIGRKLHERPHEIANYYDGYNKEKFRKNSVVAIETFIATSSRLAKTLSDGWTLVGDKGGFVAQHEHTIVVTDDKPIILTLENDI